MRQRRVQRRLVDDAAARRVDEIGRRLHAREPRGIEHADRLRRLRAMDGDEVGARQGRIEVGDRLAAGGLDRRRPARRGRRPARSSPWPGSAWRCACRCGRSRRSARSCRRGRPAPRSSRLFHWLSCTMALSSAPRLASAIIMNMACSATEGELARARHHQRDLLGGQRRHVDRVVADADARHHQHLARGGDLGFAEGRARPAPRR